jgi:hypothetical protein
MYNIFQTSPQKDEEEEEEEEEAVRPTYKGDSLQSPSLHTLDTLLTGCPKCSPKIAEVPVFAGSQQKTCVHFHQALH